MFGGSYVVDDFALVLKGLFLVAGAIVLLASVSYLRRGRYYEGEYYFLVIASIAGAVVMASARDLITMFIGLELVSAPAFLLAGWRKGDLRSNEAALKFFLIGVLSSAILLFGMSLVYGTTGEYHLRRDPERHRHGRGRVGVRPRGPVRAGRVRLQGRRRPLPLLGAGHLPGRPPARGRLPVGRLQGGRLRGPADHLLLGLRRGAGHLGPCPVDPGRPDHDAGQPHRPAPEQRGAPARLLLDSPRRLHAGPLRHGGRLRGGGAAGRLLRVAHLPAGVRLHEPGRLRRGHRHRRAHRQRGDRRLGRPGALRAGAGLPARGVLLLPRRDPAAGRVVRQVRDVQGGAGRLGQPLGDRPGGGGGPERGDLAVLLRPGAQSGLHGPGPRDAARRRAALPGRWRRPWPSPPRWCWPPGSTRRCSPSSARRRGPWRCRRSPCPRRRREEAGSPPRRAPCGAAPSAPCGRARGRPGP